VGTVTTDLDSAKGETRTAEGRSPFALANAAVRADHVGVCAGAAAQATGVTAVTTNTAMHNTTIGRRALVT
jgi:hypothetical protein